MTIKNLIKIINQQAKKAIKNKSIDEYKNNRLAFDASNTIYKLVFALRFHGNEFKNNNLVVTHLHSLLTRIIALLQNKIKPVFVFDGKPSSLKDKVIEEREAIKKKGKDKYDNGNAEEKKKYYFCHKGLSHQEMEECKKLLELLGIPVIQSPEEADAQCAYLSEHDLVDGVVSDDIDIILFGSKNILKDFTTSKYGKIKEVRRKYILKELGLTSKQLIEMGILLGCDYCPKMPKVGIASAVKLIKQYGSIKNITKDKKYNSCETFDCYKKIRKYFYEAPVTEVSKKDVKLTGYDEKKLVKFLQEKQFEEKYINDKLKLLTACYAKKNN